MAGQKQVGISGSFSDMDSNCRTLITSKSLQLEINHGEDIYTTEIGKCYKSGPFFFSSLPWELVVNHFFNTPLNIKAYFKVNDI